MRFRTATSPQRRRETRRFHRGFSRRWLRALSVSAVKEPFFIGQANQPYFECITPDSNAIQLSSLEVFDQSGGHGFGIGHFSDDDRDLTWEEEEALRNKKPLIPLKWTNGTQKFNVEEGENDFELELNAE